MPLVKKTWPKPSVEMIKLLAEHVTRFDSQERKMFGCPCFFVNGNMFAGVFSDSIFARFSSQDRDLLDSEGMGAFFEPRKGRRMTEYRTLTDKVLQTPGGLDDWLARSHAYVTSLEPKKKK
jgi:TfoX/Sxy family transcriptional regulator of competence genes